MKLPLAHLEQEAAREVYEARAIRDGGGFGSIIGRNVFQRPKEDALRLLDGIMQIYKERI